MIWTKIKITLDNIQTLKTSFFLNQQQKTNLVGFSQFKMIESSIKVIKHKKIIDNS